MLQVGSRGDEVKQLQAFLILHEYLKGVADGDFGPDTKAAVCAFQAANHLSADGIVGSETYDALRVDGFNIAGAKYPFLPAKWFESGRGGEVINLIVIHTTEGPETPHRAKATAEMFHDGEAKASANYIVDPVDIYQSVLDQDTAWHCGDRTTNRRSIGIEQNGTSQQTPAQWASDQSVAELRNVAGLCAKLCTKYSIPVVKLSPEEVKAGAAGFCGHVDVTLGINGGSGHHDPGPNFPWEVFLGMVNDAVAAQG